MRQRGVFPVVPTILDETGALDLGGQRHAVDVMIDAGATGWPPRRGTNGGCR